MSDPRHQTIDPGPEKQRFIALLGKTERTVAGVMSGTSLDGIEVAVARIEGSGVGLRFELLGHLHMPYPDGLREVLLAESMPETSSVKALSQLNARLGGLYAVAVRQALDAFGIPLERLDLVGSHGQTVHHVPDPEPCAGAPTASTLQIGDPAVLAQHLGVPVVGDFRTADMAHGGQGAPLVPYFDFVACTDQDESRLLLNLGGIANLTVLPRGARPEDVRAFDTGPANMVLDALARRLFDAPFDRDGWWAAGGQVRDELLDALLEHPFFETPPPKSTGREAFGDAFVDAMLERAAALGPAAGPFDVLATATALTAETVHRAYTRFVEPEGAVDAVFVSGGGVHNRTLMDGLARRFDPTPVRPAAEIGVDPDAKEALCFAVLAHEWCNGVPTSLPAVTGARRAALLGKLCLPAPGDS